MSDEESMDQPAVPILAASYSERRLDLTADVHKLHLIREWPEYTINALRSALTAVQQRLAAETTLLAPTE